MPSTNSDQLPQPSSPWWPLFAVGFGVVAALLLVRWAVLTPERERPEGAAIASELEHRISAVLAEENVPPEDPTVAPARWKRVLEMSREAAAGGPERVREFVYALFAALDDRTPADRLAMLRAFFEAGVDTRLGSGFAVGPGGFLSDWPTLRVAMFDFLALREPRAAQMLASRILQKRPEAPAEWVIALRELSRGTTADAWPELVSTRLRILVSDREWIDACPPGWGDGLDLIAAGRALDYLPDLAFLASRSQQRETQFAAYLTLDALVLADPGEVLDAINLDPQLLADNTGVRASLFARADVRHPGQLHALATYLARDDVLPGEKAQLVSQFPRHRVGVNRRLLTSIDSQSPQDIQAQNQATIAQIARWMEDGRFAAWYGQLAQVRDRLSAQLRLAGN